MIKCSKKELTWRIFITVQSSVSRFLLIQVSILSIPMSTAFSLVPACLCELKGRLFAVKLSSHLISMLIGLFVFEDGDFFISVITGNCLLSIVICQNEPGYKQCHSLYSFMVDDK